ncbi:MAG: hypothetical protein ACLTLI_07825 [Clostridia bacterium]
MSSEVKCRAVFYNNIYKHVLGVLFDRAGKKAAIYEKWLDGRCV